MKACRLFNTSKLVLLGMALVFPLAGIAQEAKPAKSKDTAGSSQGSQRLDPMTQTQGLAGQDADDQILIYRFRLDLDSLGSELIISNPTDRDGTISLVAQEADGAFSKEVKRTIEPGAIFSISASDAGWSSSNVVSVKASRRLLLSVLFPEADKPTDIVRDRSVAVYEVFGFERQSELVPTAKKRGLSLLYSDRRVSRELSPETAPQQRVSELLETSGSSPARGLFVLHGSR